MQRYAFFSTCLLPIILNDTLHCRPVVDIIESTYLVRFNSGSSLGMKPPKLNVFHFRKVIVAFKRGEAAIMSGRFREEPLRGRPPKFSTDDGRLSRFNATITFRKWKKTFSFWFAPRPPPGLCSWTPNWTLPSRSTRLCLTLVYNVVYYLVLWEEGLFKRKHKAA